MGGVSDLFITVMLWFIFDEKSSPIVLTQGRYSYAVMNVVRPTSVNINEVEEQEDEEEGSRLPGEVTLG